MKPFIALFSLVFFASCTSLPQEPAAQAIGSWQEIGKIHHNNISIAYDTGSLKRHGNIVTLRHRQVVDNMDEENYIDLPEYKTAVSEWAFDCAKRTYRIQLAEFWDKTGKSLGKQVYSGSLNIRPAKIVRNTPSERLLQIACKR